MEMGMLGLLLLATPAAEVAATPATATPAETETATAT